MRGLTRGLVQRLQSRPGFEVATAMQIRREKAIYDSKQDKYIPIHARARARVLVERGQRRADRQIAAERWRRSVGGSGVSDPVLAAALVGMPIVQRGPRRSELPSASGQCGMALALTVHARGGSRRSRLRAPPHGCRPKATEACASTNPSSCS